MAKLQGQKAGVDDVTSVINVELAKQYRAWNRQACLSYRAGGIALGHFPKLGEPIPVARSYPFLARQQPAP